MSISKVKELINIMKENNIKTMEIGFNNENYKLEFQDNYDYSMKTEQTKIRNNTDNIIIIKSPMIGIAYRAPAPNSKVFIETSQHVAEGTTLCIIEAMKNFHHIRAEDNFIVKEICFEDGQLIEYGQPLFKMEKLR